MLPLGVSDLPPWTRANNKNITAAGEMKLLFTFHSNI